MNRSTAVPLTCPAAPASTNVLGGLAGSYVGMLHVSRLCHGQRLLVHARLRGAHTLLPITHARSAFASVCFHYSSMYMICTPSNTGGYNNGPAGFN